MKQGWEVSKAILRIQYFRLFSVDFIVPGRICNRMTAQRESGWTFLCVTIFKDAKWTDVFFYSLAFSSCSHVRRFRKERRLVAFIGFAASSLGCLSLAFLFPAWVRQVYIYLLIQKNPWLQGSKLNQFFTDEAPAAKLPVSFTSCLFLFSKFVLSYSLFLSLNKKTQPVSFLISHTGLSIDHLAHQQIANW